MDQSELDITAELALLDLSEQERENLKGAVSQLLEYFSFMDTLNVDGLTPTTHALSEDNRLRPDQPDPDPISADELLEQAPDLEDRFIAIPNVL